MGFLDFLKGDNKVLRAIDTIYDKLSPVQKAMKDYFDKTPALQESFQKLGLDWQNIAIEGLPDEYNKVPFNGIVDGKWVKTVGEYKEEIAKWNSNHWSG